MFVTKVFSNLADHQFILKKGKLEKCLIGFGDNTWGQLGIGKCSSGKFPTPVHFFDDKKIEEIRCGEQHTLVKTSNALYGFGGNNEGQLGLGLCTAYAVPTPLDFFADMEIEGFWCGAKYTFVNTSRGLFCFGENQSGQLGIGNKYSQRYPVPMNYFTHTEIEDISCGARHTVVKTTSGFFPFGCNCFGQLGQSGGDQHRPKRLEYFDGIKIEDFCCGANHTLVKTPVRLYGFGNNHYGQLGTQPTYRNISPYPIEFFDNKKIDVIACGRDNSFVKTPDGIFSFGCNSYGQLGNETQGIRWYPMLIHFFADEEIEEICCGKEHTLVKTSCGVFGFGDNSSGQLGSEGEAIRSPLRLPLYKPEVMGIQLLKYRKSIRFLVTARALCPESLLGEDYFPLDMFRLLIAKFQ